MKKPKGPPRPGKPRPSGRSRPGVPAAGRPSATRRPSESTPPKTPPETPDAAGQPSAPELEMRPLSGGAPEAKERPTATSFFSRPTPHVGRGEKYTASHPGLKTTEPAAVTPQAAVTPSPIAPGNLSAGAHMGIQGPVASGPVVPSPETASTGARESFHSDRAKSWRLYGAVLAVMTLLFCSGVLALSLHLLGQEQTRTEEGETNARAEAPPSKPAPKPQTDTATPDPKPAPRAAPRAAPAPRPTIQPAPAPRAAPVPRPAPAPAPAPARPSGGKSPVTVSFSGDNPFTSIVVSCETTGFRARARFSGATAVVEDVPQDDCRILFKGASSASHSIRGGGGVQCTSAGGGVNCQ